MGILGEYNKHYVPFSFTFLVIAKLSVTKFELVSTIGSVILWALEKKKGSWVYK